MKPAIIDIPGIGEVAAATLAEHGFTTLRKLANTTTAQLAEVPGFSTARADRVIQAASGLLASAAATGADDDGNNETQSTGGKKNKDKKRKKDKKDKKRKKKDKKGKRKGK